jgi:hypothetical protein
MIVNESEKSNKVISYSTRSDALFDPIDADGSGMIANYELKELFNEFNLRVTAE